MLVFKMINCVNFIVLHFKSECVDSASWNDKHGDDCKKYKSSFCANGNARTGFKDRLSYSYNHPEENCCSCGKGGGIK